MDRPEGQKLLREKIRVLERMLGVLNEEMSCCGITLAQCHAIVEIGRAGSISLNDLASLLNLDSSTMSRTVNNLVNSGYVNRELSPNDRRYVNIFLTEKGAALCTEIEDGMAEKFAAVYTRIPEEKKEQVIESLQFLIDAFRHCC